MAAQNGTSKSHRNLFNSDSNKITSEKVIKHQIKKSRDTFKSFGESATEAKEVNMPILIEEKQDNDITKDMSKDQHSIDQDFISAGRNSYASDKDLSFKGTATAFNCTDMPSPAVTM